MKEITVLKKSKHVIRTCKIFHSVLWHLSSNQTNRARKNWRLDWLFKGKAVSL